ncbi:MAG TPA: glycerol-3-phosphate acyltransferase [Bacteroidales bacterium]|nr:glycerol-3-phosphate acyltransferase [Bacteroidales bacterium]
MSRMKRKKVQYPDLYKETGQWPIMNLSKNRNQFLEQVANESFQNLRTAIGNKSLKEEIETTIYRENIRIQKKPWPVDKPDEKEFWKNIRQKLIAAQSSANVSKTHEQILYDIIIRYTHEIAGNFKKTSYRLAKSLITFGFARLLNATRLRGITSIFSRQLDLDDKIHITGETEHIRSLCKLGTVVMVPTHFSNLDSILIGWVIQFLGLPAFVYGAGLNLFNIKMIAYFLNSLGAYKVDRRKINPIYLETLKTYSSLALRWGCHSLFFPGGTRSRSGAIEKNLKLGLLSTTIEAQRILYQQQEDNKLAKRIFIVPVVINYHFTLEASELINQYLKKTGQERYYREPDDITTSYKIVTFLIKFFTKGSNISVSIGRGMDILGNYVDHQGNSFDKNDNPINPRDYFVSDGKVTVDRQREQTYVRILARRIIEEFHKYNQVFASHLVAYTAFKILERSNPKLDLYSILRLPADDLIIDYEEFKARFEELRSRVMILHSEGKTGVAPHLTEDAEKAIRLGLDNVGMYHAERPVVRKGDKIIIQNTSTLFYYHNRLEGFGLEKYI